MNFLFRKMRSITPKQALLALLALVITTSIVAASLTSSWRLASVFAASALLYLSVMAILVLRQLEYRLSPDNREFFGLSASPPVGVASSVTARRKKNSGLALRPVWGAVGFYAELNAKKSKYLGKQLVRSRFVDGRDVLAHVVSKSRMNIHQLRDLLDAYRAPIKRREVLAAASKFNGDALREMARVLYRQDLSVADRLDAITCYELLYDIHGARSFSQHDVDWLLATLLATDDLDGFQAWVARFGLAAEGSVNYPFLKANALNPWRHQNAESLIEWNALLAGVYRASSIPPAQVKGVQGSPLQSLEGGHLGFAEGPLVSVIMPVYNPGPEVELAVRSILRQSWRNLEVLIVDDGSLKGLDTLAQLPNLDDRITLIRLPYNRGAYSARNEGLRAAQGELVTCHDADDWAHPMRIELQAEDLLAREDSVANISSLCRVDRKLEFKNRNSISNPNFVYPAFVTLMFKRRPVLDKIGYWDSVRKAGDSEFISRIRLVFEQDVGIIEPRVPLTFALLDEGSLSGGELYRGFLHPERSLYQIRYQEWHEDISTGVASPYMPITGERLFAAPASFLPKVEKEEYDVVFVSELGFTGGNANSLLHEIMICLDAGLKVAIARARNLLFVGVTAERKPIEPLRELISSGRIAEITLATPCEARLVMVRWPACFQYLPEIKFGIKAQKTIVIANHVPYETGNVRHFYDIQQVLGNVEKAFGVKALWAPMSAVVRRLCDPHLARGQSLELDWVAVLESSAGEIVPRTKPVSSVPSIGRHSRDDHLKWPETRAAILDIYPTDGRFEVHVMGGVSKILAGGLLTEEDMANWTLYEFNELAPTDFLRAIDFFVYYPHRELVEAFGRVIMEALTSGAVVVVPRHFEPTFGDACVYAEPAEVRQVVTELYQDWDSYLAQSRRGQDYIRRNCTPEAYIARLRTLGVTPASAVATDLASKTEAGSLARER